MEFSDLLHKKSIVPREVLVLRHRPQEIRLRKVLPWLAAERPDLFNAYQQAQFPKVEAAFTRAKYVAAFVGIEAATAVFAGLFVVKGWKPLAAEQFWQIAQNRELREAYGMSGFGGDRPGTLWFDLVRSSDFYPNWHGKLVINWPGLERSWWRWADRNCFDILCIHESSSFEQAMPAWNELVVSWSELRVLPAKWKATLREWRGIYYIVDTSDGKGYVGSASGSENLLGRWLGYSVSGHGGNVQLRVRNPKDFQFSILQRVSPDMPTDEVIKLEQTWKTRLHTLEYGLNEN